MMPQSPSWTRLNTKAIETMITELCAGQDTDPDLHELLAAVAEQRGVEALPEDLSRGARFVFSYIEQVPYMMTVAWTAASNVGLENEMRRILEMVESYWAEGDDVIPDDLGVIGLLDDAYCSLTSLQAVSDHYQLQTGKHLFPNDLSVANQAMRRIIGEPYASELDRIVIGAMKTTGLIEAVKSLASEEKRLDFSANSTIWSHGPAGRAEVGDLANLGILDD
jgi:uncharacterized membrane protein YkvA (DUF1232 family)